MAKIKLGSRPKSFKRPVKFPMLDGSTGVIEVEYRYRTRTEYGAFIDSIREDASDGQSESTDEKFSLEKLLARSADKNADYLLEVIDGWNLDEPVTREFLLQLQDEFPAAATAIMETYRLAVTEGHVKN